jgi:predicted amidohydrolase YtcJ
MNWPWKAKPFDEQRKHQLAQALKTAEMLGEWQAQESYRWLMEKAQQLKDIYIAKRDAAAADGILQLTNEINHAMALTDSALAELEDLQDEQRGNAPKPHPAEADESETPARRHPQPT